MPEQQEAQLNDLAMQTGLKTEELVREAVARLLAYNEWFKQQVQIGIDQIARGEFIEEEEMAARVEPCFALEEYPMRTCGRKSTPSLSTVRRAA